MGKRQKAWPNFDGAVVIQAQRDQAKASLGSCQKEMVHHQSRRQGLQQGTSSSPDPAQPLTRQKAPGHRGFPGRRFTILHKHSGSL